MLASTGIQGLAFVIILVSKWGRRTFPKVMGSPSNEGIVRLENDKNTFNLNNLTTLANALHIKTFFKYVAFKCRYPVGNMVIEVVGPQVVEKLTFEYF